MKILSLWCRLLENYFQLWDLADNSKYEEIDPYIVIPWIVTLYKEPIYWLYRIKSVTKFLLYKLILFKDGVRNKIVTPESGDPCISVHVQVLAT
jgi:hypothetical protein